MLFHTHFFFLLTSLSFLKSLPKGLFPQQPNQCRLKNCKFIFKNCIAHSWFSLICSNFEVILSPLNILYNFFNLYHIYYVLSLSTCCHVDSEEDEILVCTSPWVLKQFLVYCIYSMNMLLYNSINLLFESYITEG